jgi:uncharacterized protein (TIGR03067 family)
MNRLILIFFLIFAGAFGSAFLLIQGVDRPTAPGPAAAVKPANNEDSLANAEQSSAPTSATDPDQNKAQRATTAGDLDPKTNESEKPLNKPAASPKPIERSAPQPNKPKRVVANKRPATPKPAETNRVRDPDLDRLRGTWRIVDTEYDGERMAKEAQNYTWEFRADQYTIKHKGNFAELWTAQLNSTCNPQTIDGTHDITRKKLLGIYELSNDTLKVSYDLTGNGRPDSFQAPKGSRRVCYYFKR